MAAFARSVGVLTLLIALTASGLPAALGSIYPRPIDPDWETEDLSATRPSLATDGHGTWVAAWQAAAPSSLDEDILFSRSMDGGLTWTPVALLNSNGDDGPLDGRDLRPSVAADSLGHLVAVWIGTLYDPSDELMQQYGEDQEILFSHSADGGATWSEAAVLNSNAMVDDAHDSNPVIINVGENRFVAAWNSPYDLSGSATDERDIYFSQSTDAGATWSVLGLVNNTGASDFTDETLPRLAWDGGANWVAVWATREGNADYDIGSAFTGDEGLSWSDPVIVNSNAGADDISELDNRVAALASGSWVVAWWTEIGGDGDIYFSRSTTLGQQWTPAQPLNSDAASDERDDILPVLVTDDQGRVIAAWAAEGGEIGDDGDLMFAVSDDDGNSWGDPRPLNGDALADTRDDVRVALAEDGDRWLAVWRGRANPFTDSDILLGIFLENAPSGLVLTGGLASPGL